MQMMSTQNRCENRRGWVTRLGFGCFVVWCLGVMPVWGQEPVPASTGKTDARPPTAQTHPNNPELWNVEMMMEEAVLQISRRYNLNKAQEDYTRLLLVKRVTAFLDKHEPEVRELLKESIDLRLGKKAGTAESYAKWALRAAPVYAEAQSAILEGNEEWGAILNDDQKKIHQNDLNQMKSNFQNVDRLLEGWKAGKGPNLPVQANQTIQSGNSATGQQGRVSDPQAPIVQRLVEDNWLAYVNRFINTYNFDDKQKIAARDKIYKDIRDEVVKYREKRKDEFAKLDAEALSPKSKPEEIERRRNELEKPIQERFVLLDSRLRQLVDRKQMAEAKPDEKQQLEAWFKILSGQVGEKLRKESEKEAASHKPPPSPFSETSDKKAVKSAEKPAPAPEPAPTSQKAPE